MAAVVSWISESVQEIPQISGLTLQTCLVFFAAFLLTCALLRRPRNLPPYPAGHVPVLGHLLALGRAPLLKLTAWRRQYGDVFTVRMGMEDVVVLNGYTAVKDALVDRSELFASRPPNYLFDSSVGFGKGETFKFSNLFVLFILSNIGAARWGTGLKQRRRFATAALKHLGMKVGTGSVEDNIRQEASYVRATLTPSPHPSLPPSLCLYLCPSTIVDVTGARPTYNLQIAEYHGQPFAISNDMKVAVANVICSMAFGRRYGYEDETFRELSEAIRNLLAEIGSGQFISVFPLLRFVPGVNRACKEVLKHLSKIHEVLWDEIARHRENFDRENPRDFLDFCLLELEQREKVEGLTEENVLYMAQNLFLAGTDTTANTLLWSLLYMTLNPDIQNKVHEELDAVLGVPALSHRSQLPYVNACLLETLRIRTILPFAVPHATTKAVRTQGFDIPRGTQVLPNLYSLHMDPAFWPDPDRFDPGRFLDAEGNLINKPQSFMPFSGGRRVCLGEQLARMELFLFFSTLLQSFNFKTPEGAPAPNTDGVLGLTLVPHPFQLCAMPR
ncbi:cytochrome P450 2D4-like [Branchiostoma floridae]|uniref:Cytochrome P450 2D4-like n=1 Tax=Branchiostoma floridae TaxID=7739 RepID=A0A9J7KIR4_BRAFL|nr:cytochrome P450 2D4-like [Branchiostoma floridae]